MWNDGLAWLVNVFLIAVIAFGCVFFLRLLWLPPTRNPDLGLRDRWKSLQVGPFVSRLALVLSLVALAILLTGANRVHVVPTPTNYVTEVVSQVPELDYSPFAFVRDESVVDLRASRSQPLLKYFPILGRRSNPATLLNSMLIRKLRDANEISFTYSTSGTELDVRCLSLNCKLKKLLTNDEHSSVIMKTNWELTADLSDVPVGTDFTMVVEVTYYNAYERPEQWFYNTYSNKQRQDETLSALLIFPNDRVPKDIYIKTQPEHTDAEKNVVSVDFQGGTRIKGPQNRSFYWQLSGALPPNQAYELHWEY